MSRKLPPLKALRAFEATARHLSFTEAADELHVTPAAIGHQVRALEDYFDQKLLIRSTRKVELTDKLFDVGRELASIMVELFADIEPGHELMEQFSFISSDDLPEFQALLSRIGRDGIEALRPEDRTNLLSLPFKVSPARHRRR